MSVRVRVSSEAERLGQEYGADLASALLLSSHDASVSLKRRLAAIVLDQIKMVLHKMEAAALPDAVIARFEKGARIGVREGLQQGDAATQTAYRLAA